MKLFSTHDVCPRTLTGTIHRAVLGQVLEAGSSVPLGRYKIKMQSTQQQPEILVVGEVTFGCLQVHFSFG